MLGIEDGRELEQGAPIWNSKISERRTFFLAKNYLGADGFYANKSVHMLKHLFNSTYESEWEGEVKFKFDDILHSDSGQHRRTMIRINKMNLLQNAWAKNMIVQ